MRRSLIIFLGLILLGVATYYLLFMQDVTSVPAPVLSEVQDFSLIDTEGKPFTKNELAGKVWVADLVFTSCEMMCPMMTRKLKTVADNFADVADLRLVSVSVDPEIDTPEVLKKYAADHGATDPRWFFLTGKMTDIRKLAIESFKLATTDSPSLHSNRFVLVDRNARVRGYFDPEDKAQMRKLLEQLRSVINEK